MQKIMRLLLLGGMAALVPLAGATTRFLDHTGTGNDGTNFHGDAEVTNAIAALATGDELQITEAATYAIPATISITGNRDITITNTSGGAVIINGAANQVFNTTAAAGALVLRINGSTGGLTITDACITGRTVNILQNATITNTTSVTLTNVTVSNTGVANVQAQSTLILQGSNTDNGGPVSFSMNNCTISQVDNSSNATSMFGTFGNGSFQTFDALTVNCNGCTFNGGSTTANVAPTMSLASGVAATTSDNQSFTFTNCAFNCMAALTANSRTAIGYGEGSSSGSINTSSFTFRGCTMKLFGGGKFIGFTELDDLAASTLGNTYTFDRCTIENYTTGAASNAWTIRMGQSNLTAGPVNTTSTLNVYNCLFKSSSGAAAQNSVLRVEGRIKLAAYHNTFVSLATGGASAVGNCAIGMITGDTQTPGWTASDNVFYNYSFPVTFAAGTTTGTVFGPRIACSRNLVAGPNPANSAQIDPAYAGTGVTLGTNTINTNFYPLSGSAAVLAASSFYNDGNVGTAIGNVDLTGTSRYDGIGLTTVPFDIGALQLAQTPVELTAFSAE